MRQESHRVFLQRQNQHAETTITSAAIRLTDAARAVDVTELLRRKFGLEEPSFSSDTSEATSSTAAAAAVATGSSSNSRLVLVGTLVGVLPKHYIQFEHEVPRRRRQQQQQQQQQQYKYPNNQGGLAATTSSVKGTTNTTASSSSSSASFNNTNTTRQAPYETMSEPFHVIRTVQPQENPLFIRDEMLKHLEARQSQAEQDRLYSSMDKKQQKRQQQQQQSSIRQTATTMMRPNIRWFFSPGGRYSFLALDGYCSSMECDNEESDKDDGNDDKNERSEQLVTSCVEETKPENESCSYNDTLPLSEMDESRTEAVEAEGTVRTSSQTQEMKKLLSELHKMEVLSRYEASVDSHCVSGYLLKQSSRDPHVWRRVHCVLTDDQLWVVRRMKNIGNQRIGRHSVISLVHAALLWEPPTSSTMGRHNGGGGNININRSSPENGFALAVAERGRGVHAFRAASSSLLMQWIQCLSDRIMQCQENRLMDHAELIVVEETVARHKRMEQTLIFGEVSKKNNNNNRNSAATPASLALVHFALDVARYKEQCRHLKDILPNRVQVIVAGRSPQIFSKKKPENNNSNTNKTNSPPLKKTVDDIVNKNENDDEGVPKEIVIMVRSAWNAAADLLERARRFQRRQSTAAAAAAAGEDALVVVDQKKTRTIDTLFLQAQYIVTGQMRPSSPARSRIMSPRYSTEPPPPDLFDAFLREIQVKSALQ